MAGAQYIVPSVIVPHAVAQFSLPTVRTSAILSLHVPSHSTDSRLLRAMTDPSVNPDSPLPASPADAQSKSPTRWKKATLAGLLSLFFPGLGQLYNRQPRKAFGMAIVTHLLSALVTHTRLLLSFWTMVATLLVLLGWKLLASAEAAYTAATAKKPEAPVPLPRFTYSLLAVIVFLATFFPTFEHVKHQSGFSAFKVPSTSMCPTICVGDRVVADMWAYHWKPPQRGDLILLKHPSSEALFIKRVIALPGDLVAPGPGGSVLVNGQPFHPPAPCGDPTSPNGEPVDYSSVFKPIKVPDGTLFVVGDNLDHSFDSRIPDFGPVSFDMVRGKPLYFYWSPAHSRIACSIH